MFETDLIKRAQTLTSLYIHHRHIVKVSVPIFTLSLTTPKVYGPSLSF
ncbi:uncharacterized protein FTOL_13936 [Fusarium torulosum]|uniref:Uncharacterized protein n=1 Tax=Fusarium torulosum TaxID=33205 RepID=A0AAE8SQP6_9HYPO|nr:uncharacterized protein FTOL_13936 [Fusarium torulosum]